MLFWVLQKKLPGENLHLVMIRTPPLDQAHLDPNVALFLPENGKHLQCLRIVFGEVDSWMFTFPTYDQSSYQWYKYYNNAAGPMDIVP